MLNKILVGGAFALLLCGSATAQIGGAAGGAVGVGASTAGATATGSATGSVTNPAAPGMGSKGSATVDASGQISRTNPSGVSGSDAPLGSPYAPATSSISSVGGGINATPSAGTVPSSVPPAAGAITSASAAISRTPNTGVVTARRPSSGAVNAAGATGK